MNGFDPEFKLPDNFLTYLEGEIISLQGENLALKRENHLLKQIIELNKELSILENSKGEKDDL